MTRIMSWSVIAGAAVLTTIVNAASYTITVPGNGDYQLVAYSYNTNTVENAIGEVSQELTLQFWDSSVQNWVIDYYVDGEWSDPDRVITPGEAFLIAQDGTEPIEVTIYGTALTSSPYTRQFQKDKWYLVGSAYPLALQGGNFLECMDPANYTPHSLDYEANINDLVSLLDAFTQEYETHTRTTYENGKPKWTGEGTYVSPTIQFIWPVDDIVGCGFWLKPAQNTTWAQSSIGATCQ